MVMNRGNRIVEQQKLHRIVTQLATCVAEFRTIPAPTTPDDFEEYKDADRALKIALDRVSNLLYDEADR